MKLLRVILLNVILLFLFACAKDDAPPASTIVLVHGAWQGAYVWQTVKTQLEQKGHHVVTVELPGHGSDTTSPSLSAIMLRIIG